MASWRMDLTPGERLRIRAIGATWRMAQTTARAAVALIVVPDAAGWARVALAEQRRADRYRTAARWYRDRYDQAQRAAEAAAAALAEAHAALASASAQRDGWRARGVMQQAQRVLVTGAYLDALDTRDEALARADRLAWRPGPGAAIFGAAPTWVVACARCGRPTDPTERLRHYPDTGLVEHLDCYTEHWGADAPTVAGAALAEQLAAAREEIATLRVALAAAELEVAEEQYDRGALDDAEFRAAQARHAAATATGGAR